MASLAFHALPASEAHVIYDYGRMDLRDEVRAAMYVIIESIIKKPAASRTTHEQNLYSWLQSIVYSNEINYYKLAIGQYNSFSNDPCHFTLDPDIAAAFKLSYDGTQFCFGGLGSSIFAAPVPDVSYFKAYGLKFSYNSKAQADPNYAAVFVDSAELYSLRAGRLEYCFDCHTGWNSRQTIQFHDGTGTLSGTYTGAFLQQICINSIGAVCGGFIATNSQGTVKQTFELDMATSPVALLGLPTQANLHAGVPNSVLLTSYCSRSTCRLSFPVRRPWRLERVRSLSRSFRSR
jgi:hypothetical protein